MCTINDTLLYDIKEAVNDSLHMLVRLKWDIDLLSTNKLFVIMNLIYFDEVNYNVLYKSLI